MTPAEVLRRLEAEGVGVTLALDLEATAEPTDDLLSLIREHRDALLEHLARELVGTPDNVPGLTLYGDLFHSLMVWAARYSALRLEHPGGVILNAKPEHLTDALDLYPWGVVYDPTKAVLVTWGDAPRYALLDKRDLKTEQYLMPEERETVVL